MSQVYKMHYAKCFVLLCFLASVFSVLGVVNSAYAAEGGTITFNLSNSESNCEAPSVQEKTVAYASDNSILGIPKEIKYRYRCGFINAAYFQAWSTDKELKNNSKIWFPATTIRQVKATNDGKLPVKLYAIYVNDRMQNLLNKDLNQVYISQGKSVVDIMPNNFEDLESDAKDFVNPSNESSKSSKKAVFYFNQNTDNKLKLYSNFHMNPYLSLITFNNASSAPGYDSGIHLLTNQYVDTEKKEDKYQQFVAKVREKDPKISFSDLTMQIDDRVEIPNVVRFSFKSYNYVPIAVFDENYNELKFLDLSADIAPGNPVTKIEVLTKGNHNFIVRCVIRNKAIPNSWLDDKDAKILHKPYWTTIPDNVPIIKEAIDNESTILPPDKYQAILKDMELNIDTALKIPKEEAKKIALSYKKTGNEDSFIKIDGKIKVKSVVGKTRKSFTPIVNQVELFPNNIRIGFTVNKVLFDQNYKDKPANSDKTVYVEHENTIGDDDYAGEAEVDFPAKPTRSAGQEKHSTWEFVGWNIDKNADYKTKDGWFDSQSTVDSDKIVYAIWRKNTSVSSHVTMSKAPGIRFTSNASVSKAKLADTGVDSFLAILFSAVILFSVGSAFFIRYRYYG